MYIEFKEFFNSYNLNEDCNDIFNFISKIDKTVFIRRISYDIYADNRFFIKFKAFIKENKEQLDIELFSLFNILFYHSPDKIDVSFDYLFKSDIDVDLLKGLMAGDIRHYHKIVKEYYLKSSVDSKYNLVFFQYFLARNYEFSEISKFINLELARDFIKKNKIKVALLISGQVRGLEPAIKSWVDSFNLNDVDLDIFISSWVESGQPSKLDWNRIGMPENIDNLKDKYFDLNSSELLNKLSFHLPPKIINEDYLRNIISKYVSFNNIVIELEESNNFLNYTNPMKLYYKIDKCFNLSKKLGVYDLYFRIRPDVITFDAKINLYELYNELNNGSKIFTQYPYVLEYYGFGVDDKIAIAKYENMSIYSSTWDVDENQRNEMKGHINLANNLLYHNVNVKKIPGLRVRFSNYNLVGDTL